MSTTGITSSLLAQITDSTSTENEFVTNLNQLSSDLQSGNLSAAQEDYVTLSAAALKGVTASTATSSASGITDSILSDVSASSSSAGAFVTDLNQVGSDLQSGDLSAAQGDMVTLDSTALSAASEGSSASASTTDASGTRPTPPVDSQKLIQAIVEAIAAGDDSAVSSDMAVLATIAQSSAGATVLQQESANYGSGASGSSATSSISQLL